MPMKLRTWAMLIAGIFLCASFVRPVDAFEDRVVAVVNDDVITLSELNEVYEPILARIKADDRAKMDEKIRDQAKKSLLDRLIRDILIEQEAKRLSVTVGDKEIDAVIEDRLAEKKATKKDLLNALAKENMSYERYRDDIRKEIMRMKLVRRELQSKIAVSDEDIGRYYKRHRDKYEGKESVRIAQILVVIPRDADEATRAGLRSRAEMILEKIRAGERFDLLARQYSQGPASGEGGDLGFIEKGMIVPEVEKVAFSLEKGEVSDVVESPVGFHILTITDKRGVGAKPLEEVREEIISAIGNQRMEAKFMEWIDELVEKAHIDIRL